MNEIQSFIFIACIITLIVIIISNIVRPKKKINSNKDCLMVTIKHIIGLPIPENIFCTLSYKNDGIEFKSGNTSFNLSNSKITDMRISTETEIQKQYVSSAGGAVGGALLFGPLGAIVGGRAKEKKSEQVKSYFIITYIDNEEVKYISFDCTLCFEIHKFIKEFNSREHATIEVTL